MKREGGQQDQRQPKARHADPNDTDNSHDIIKNPTFSYDGEGGNYVDGTIVAGAASGSPYQVEVVATDGRWSDTVRFDWIVRPPGTVSIQNYDEPQCSFVNQAISNFQIYAESGPTETLAFNATGLPPGLAIDPQTGVISGTFLPVAASPSVLQTNVTATSSTDRDP